MCYLAHRKFSLWIACRTISKYFRSRFTYTDVNLFARPSSDHDHCQCREHRLYRKPVSCLANETAKCMNGCDHTTRPKTQSALDRTQIVPAIDGPMETFRVRSRSHRSLHMYVYCIHDHALLQVNAVKSIDNRSHIHVLFAHHKMCNRIITITISSYVVEFY